MVKEYTLRASNVRNEEIKSNIIQDLNQRIGARQDCKVLIQPYDLRSLPALRAYWVMVNNVVKWDADNHGYKATVWDEWFKREAGLTEEIDTMPLWEMKYASFNLKIKAMDEPREYIVWDNKERRIVETLCDRFIQKTRSIGNKGDVTKGEMGRLLMTVIKFGAENGVPGCFIKDLDFENMLKGFKDE